MTWWLKNPFQNLTVVMESLLFWKEFTTHQWHSRIFFLFSSVASLLLHVWWLTPHKTTWPVIKFCLGNWCTCKFKAVQGIICYYTVNVTLNGTKVIIFFTVRSSLLWGYAPQWHQLIMLTLFFGLKFTLFCHHIG